MNLEIDIEGWPSADWPDLTERASQSVQEIAPELANQRLTASVLFTVDAEVRKLNREWRSIDKPTNVLSFPMLTREELLALTPDGGPEMLGDLALAYGICASEAAKENISLSDHAAHLIIHGLLHLAGYDHVHSDSEADAMEGLEIKALANMGLNNPY